MEVAGFWKRVLYRSVLPVVIMLAGPFSANAQVPTTASYEEPVSVAGFDRFLEKAITALRRGNPGEAEDFLKEARKEAQAQRNKEDKDRARDAMERVKHLYAPFYELFDAGLKSIDQQEWPTAEEKLSRAAALMEQFQGIPFPAFEELDDRLTKQVTEELRIVRRQRSHVLQENLRRGEQYLLSKNFPAAIREFDAAANLLLPKKEQAEMDRIRNLSNQAYYGMYLEEGEQALQQKNYNAALEYFKEARLHLDGYEISKKIEEMQDRLHYQLLEKGQQAFFAGRYEEATGQLEQAAALQESDYLERIRSNAYEQLRKSGQKALKQKHYEAALQAFENARLFVDNNTIREDIANAAAATQYDENLSNAAVSIEAGKMKRARRQLRRAQNHVDEALVQEKIAAIDSYLLKIKEGRKLLKKDPAGALKKFDAAHTLFPTEEAKSWQAKARKAAGGNNATNSVNFYRQ